MPFAAAWMDLEIIIQNIILGEICQRKIGTVCFHYYLESKKQNKRGNMTRKKQFYRYREQISGCQRVWVQRWMK